MILPAAMPLRFVGASAGGRWVWGGPRSSPGGSFRSSQHQGDSCCLGPLPLPSAYWTTVFWVCSAPSPMVGLWAVSLMSPNLQSPGPEGAARSAAGSPLSWRSARWPGGPRACLAEGRPWCPASPSLAAGVCCVCCVCMAVRRAGRGRPSGWWMAPVVPLSAQP